MVRSRAVATSSRFADGSSITTTRGRIASTDATATACFSPLDRSKMLRSIRCATPHAPAASATRRRISSAGTPRFSHENAISDDTSVAKNWLRGSWNTDPTAPASRCTLTEAGSMPHTSTEPSSAPPSKKWGTSPFSRRVAVVLPHPLAPSSSTSFPPPARRSRPRSAGWPSWA